jgi:hypothetical protein
MGIGFQFFCCTTADPAPICAGRTGMAYRTFVAFSSADPLVSDVIVGACEAATSEGSVFNPWNRNDASGQPIDRSVYNWVDGADAFVADISEPNHNVTYEVGLALGTRKPSRLIRAANKDRRLLEEIGLLHNLGHDDYRGRSELIAILQRPFTTTPWPHPKRSQAQPVYVLQSSRDDDLLRKMLSGIKKILRMRFRSFNPQEIDRLTASEAFEQIVQSFGVVAIWHAESAPEAFRQNQRAAFAVGVARGLGIPFLLLAHDDMRLPLDLDECATRWSALSDVDRVMRDFREIVADAQQDYVDIRPTSGRYLDIVHCGDPAAENEATSLDSYFLETEQFRLTLNGELNIILGRKGSGKTAIFIQTRDKIRANKNNIVIDLAPEGFQLIKLKEFILAQLSLGTRKEFVAAFWEYIVWLEIAYKLLEKDERRVRYDSRLLETYLRLEAAYKQRVEGSGDFAVRLTDLTDRILGRYQAAMQSAENQETVSSKTLEIVYGSEIRTMRDEVLGYLKLKGVVCFLFDNLDRFWTPTGFADLDAHIIIGLVECLQDIRKRFTRANINFHWAIFLRSDVYEFVVRGMADYGKLAAASIEWGDRELLRKMFERRVMQGFGDNPPSWASVWAAVSTPVVGDHTTLDFLIDASLMRPRYLIRLFETARRRAVTLGRDRIDETDYKAGLEELGWQVLEDFDRELSDVVPDAEELLFELAQLGKETSLASLRRIISTRVNSSETVEAVIDVLIWTGCIGVRNPNRTYYISDCGFKRPFLRALITDDNARCIAFHPTLASIFATPETAPVRSAASRRRSEANQDARQGALLI